MKTFSIALNSFKKTLLPLEKHLKLRNFLVGYSLTLADVTLIASLVNPLQTVLDQQYRKDTIPNLSRYCDIILSGKAFVQTFGRIHFAKKMLQPII
jgi:glutathione S-transferase